MIFIVDQAVYSRRGNSLWVNRRREFLFLIPQSVFFWMIFEGLNFYLQNWHYEGITREAAFRWPGYFIAYGTVLPALFETTELLDALGLFRHSRVRPIPGSRAWYWPFFIMGGFFLYAPVFWPECFFPLIWGAFVFLLEPALHMRGGHSLMREWEGGSPRTFLLLLTAGFICGVLWEFWNFWAVSKWVYTVPHVGFLKVFEMPALGFGGFPPLAVACYVMTNAVSLFRHGRTWVPGGSVPTARTHPLVILAGLVLFIAIFIMGGRVIEHCTIYSYV